MFNGHVDTVGVEDMAIASFEPFIANGNLHGRGACDMKGPLAAMIAATQALISSGVKLSGDLQVSAVIDEEYISCGTEKLLENFRPNAAIVGEPTNLDIAVAHNGIVRLEIETFGKAAHGSVPEIGIDAIVQMAKLILRLEELKHTYLDRRHALTGIPKLHTSTINGGSEWSMVPDFCRVRVERRTVPGETSSVVINELKQILEELKKEDPQFNAEIRLVLNKQPMEISAQEDVVKILQIAFREVRQSEPKIIGQPYWTDASIFVNKAFIPTCIFGPGNIDVAHSKDEYIKIDDVVDSAKIYALAAKNFLEEKY
jgi:acetylornithine deacetylase/succinyl-diaminopimelate desuccinylase family protein